MVTLRVAKHQAGLEVVDEAGKGQVASASTDQTTWNTGTGGEAGLQLWAHVIPIGHLDILKIKHQLL